jgi:NADPH:quinone reductase-like Zn-dependent oxidoreductase
MDRPAMMPALLLEALGGPEQLVMGELPIPDPGPGEVLVHVATVGANRQDLVTASGRFPNPDLVLPHVLGMDPAGVVVALGEGVTDPVVGTRVAVKPGIACGTCGRCVAGEDDGCDRAKQVGVNRPGGMAAFLTVPARNAVPLPEGLGFVEATALAHALPVALTALRRVGVRAGETVLVDGAAGAVGSAAVQAAALLGARVIAAVGGRDGVDWLESLQPAVRPVAIVDYVAEPAFGSAVRAVAPGGVDVLVETASSPAIWNVAIAQVARHGRVAVLGAHAGPVAEVNLNLLFRLRLSLIGCSGSSAAAFREALALAADGHVMPRIDAVLPLAEARAAFGRLLARQNHGKVVLRVADPDIPA